MDCCCLVLGFVCWLVFFGSGWLVCLNVLKIFCGKCFIVLKDREFWWYFKCGNVGFDVDLC